MSKIDEKEITEELVVATSGIETYFIIFIEV